MSYVYAELRPTVLTEEGVEMLTTVRRTVERALKIAGAVRAQEALSNVSGDTWKQLAVLDYMVEKREIREIREVEQAGAATQHRIFVSGP